MTSHHMIGSGTVSPWLAGAAGRAEDLVERVRAEVEASGLQVVAHSVTPFPNHGMTVVWVLAESHLVLHYWGDEGFATVDIHVCDFRASNAAAARTLQERMSRRCFEPGTESWRTVDVEHRAARAVGRAAASRET